MGYGRGSFVTDIDIMCMNKEENIELDMMIKKSFEVLQPSNDAHCTMLVVLNLAEPQWVKVPCSQRLLYTIVCSKRPIQEVNITPQLFQPNCQKDTVLINNTCYIFFRLLNVIQIRKAVHLNCRNYSMAPSFLDKASKFEVIFTAVEVTRLSLLSIHPLYMNLVIYEKAWMKIVTKQKNISINAFLGADVFYVCEEPVRENHNIASYGNIVQCRNGRYISSFYFLSMDKECGNSKEEKSIVTQRSQTSCENSANGSICICSFLFYKYYKGDCISYINLDALNGIIDQNSSEKFIKDHNDISDDEPIYFTKNLQCKQPDQLPCKPGSSICFSFSSICIYRLGRYDTLIPCKTGSHLQECRNFVCNLHFKCPGYYCIPWGYICDRKWDCPFGYDEIRCLQKHCYRKFKCVRSQICLHTGDICDGYNDCPWNDDELMCTLVGMKCPEKCKCLNFGIICTNVSVDVRSFSNLPHISVHATKCKIKSLLNLDLNHDMIVLNLSTNLISNTCIQKFMRSLTILDLSYNQIIFITKGCFDSLEKLMVLRLQKNKIERIDDNSFYNLTNLLTLDLSNNKLSTFSKQAFTNITQLNLLILHNNPFTGLFVTMFDGLSSKLIITDNYKICCLTSGETNNCIIKINFHKACHIFIMDSVIIAATVSVFIIIVLNIISIILNSNYTDGPVKIIVNAHGVVNIMYSFYLIIILAMDTYYHENILIYESQWRSSVFCTVAFAIVLNFYFVSIFLTLILSFGRLMIVLYPLDSKFIVKTFVSQRLLFGVCALGFLSLSAGVIVKLTKWKTPSILCSPFIDAHGSSLGTRVITAVLLFIKISAFLFMTGMYTCMIQNIKRPKENMQISNQRDTFPIVIQVVSLIISNFIWIVPSVIYILCLFLKYYPKDTLAWITMTIVPIKCIMDPIIFIIVTPKQNRNKHKTVEYP